MQYPTRIYYTETDKALMWDRWQKGESLHSIARHFGRGHSSIQGILARTGGIRPPQRRRSRRALTLSEREEHVVSSLASRFVRLQHRSVEPLQPSVVRSTATVAGDVTERVKRIIPPGIERTVPRPVNWLRTLL